MSYLYKGITYNNYDAIFMAGLGMSVETISSIHDQRKYELTTGPLTRRQAAYERESDPLYLEWQYDRTPEAELAWRNKVAEIKARYPVSM
ncbi:hypothetical protein KAM351_27140 [Aeromonas caviae]|uniref:Uncharacterized protein n=1 Tax=Aeromonas caviae TaxID=648 RepID=A0AA37FVS2_AERCA|nr:hypothetical protein [Aeromonas caviae]GJA64103.1 hypothetical protein KAM351_27140 [Aeromonas caviae]